MTPAVTFTNSRVGLHKDCDQSATRAQLEPPPAFLPLHPLSSNCKELCWFTMASALRPRKTRRLDTDDDPPSGPSRPRKRTKRSVHAAGTNLLGMPLDMIYEVRNSFTSQPPASCSPIDLHAPDPRVPGTD